MKTQMELREEAVTAYEAMTPSDYKSWVRDFAESGNLISMVADTNDAIMEMFVQEYIEVNG